MKKYKFHSGKPCSPRINLGLGYLLYFLMLMWLPSYAEALSPLQSSDALGPSLHDRCVDREKGPGGAKEFRKTFDIHKFMHHCYPSDVFLEPITDEEHQGILRLASGNKNNPEQNLMLTEVYRIAYDLPPLPLYGGRTWAPDRRMPPVNDTTEKYVYIFFRSRRLPGEPFLVYELLKPCPLDNNPDYENGVDGWKERWLACLQKAKKSNCQIPTVLEYF